MGHALNNTLQDIIVRYRRMQGFNALWMPGMDHAGIATQNVVEQGLAAEGKTRHDLGREKFIERVWEWKEKYGGVIIDQLKRLGSSCDWERQRFTMDDGLSHAVREVFVRLYNEGLIYQGDYIVNWCPRCHTAISDLEVEYREEASFLWNIRYPYADGSGHIIVATTRPETMLGDTAVAVHPDDARYCDKVGKEVVLPLVNRRIPVIADDYVTMEFGSGAVKITPSSDPNDFAMAGRHNLEIIKTMDGNAVINELGGVYCGQDRYTCRENVVRDLEAQGLLVGTEPYTHNVGRCYRCKTDIEPAVSKQWFVKITPLAKEAMAAVIKGNTRIIPSTWEATYFDWMNNIRDWCISRQIWWGHRIPVWYCDQCGKVIVATQTPDSCPDCRHGILRQDEDVLDTWFSSALWPFSTLGWPEETKALQTFYPTSLLITGFDILFFWVARMMMMGLYVMKDVPFREVCLHALVRDEKGEKMSKSKGNSIDPLEVIDKYGADAFRFTLAAFTAQGRDVRISEERIEGYKFFINKIWNATRFTVMHLEGFSAGDDQELSRGSDLLADRWIRSRLQRAIGEVTQYLDQYRFNDAAASIYQFIWHEFCDWYLELIKPVLYGKEQGDEKEGVLRTLYLVWRTCLKLLHPFMPFLTEEIWQKCITADTAIMVSDFPKTDASQEDQKGEEEMALIMEVITKIRNIRGEMSIPPARKIAVTLSVPEEKTGELIDRDRQYLVHQANLSELTIAGDMTEPDGVATGVVGSIRIFVFLEGLVDFSAERQRLEKEMTKVEKDLQIVTGKLANANFREKASPQIIEKEKQKHQSLTEKYAALESLYRKFKEMRD
jgi:valyl-tRNA synthetase